MMRRTLIVLLAALAGGCGFGMTADKFRPAHDPHGVECRLVTSTVEFSGELIDVRETGVVVLSRRTFIQTRNGTIEKADGRLRLIPYAAVRRSRFEQLARGVSLSGGRLPTAQRQEQLRLVSRFPQGLPPELLIQLLKAQGQTELAGIQP